MKNLVAAMILCFFSGITAAQKTAYDIVNFSPPLGWKKEEQKNSILYSRIDGGSWCQLIIYRSTASAGTIEEDSKLEWQRLVKEPYNCADNGETAAVQTAGAWQIQSRSGIWQYNGSNVASVLTTYSNKAICISILCNATAQPYLKNYKNLINSVRLNTGQAEKKKADMPTGNSSNTSFGFTSTNWDDGWVTKAADNWAEISKSNIRVLVHFANKEADAYNSVLKDGLQHAWNMLISPRYSNIRNIEWKPIQSYESIAFAEADAIEKATGKSVHIVLFKKHYSNGNGRYLEFITADKRSFEQEFGPYHNDEFGWEKLSNMQYRNKFAVQAKDLTGTWISSDYASLSYYYVNGGGFAGATATSIAHEFRFLNNTQYQSDHAGASGVVGNQRFSRQVYKGNFTVNVWNMELTNRFQGAAEKYECYFEATSGGRILVMTDSQRTVYTLVKQK